MPEETSIFIGGLRLTVARIILLVLLPYALFRFGQHMVTRSYRFVVSDALIIPTALWMVLAVSMTEGIDRAIVGCGVTALEFAGAYFAARALLTGPGQALLLAQWVSMLIAIAGFLAPLDTITGHHVIHDVLGSITGYEPGYQVDVRRGLLRSAGTMEHPILLGTACVAGMLLGLGAALAAAMLCHCGHGDRPGRIGVLGPDLRDRHRVWLSGLSARDTGVRGAMAGVADGHRRVPGGAADLPSGAVRLADRAYDAGADIGILPIADLALCRRACVGVTGFRDRVDR